MNIPSAENPRLSKVSSQDRPENIALRASPAPIIASFLISATRVHSLKENPLPTHQESESDFNL